MLHISRLIFITAEVYKELIEIITIPKYLQDMIERGAYNVHASSLLTLTKCNIGSVFETCS